MSTLKRIGDKILITPILLLVLVYDLIVYRKPIDFQRHKDA